MPLAFEEGDHVYLCVSPQRHPKIWSKRKTCASIHRTLPDHIKVWTHRLPCATTRRLGGHPQCFPRLSTQEVSASSIGKGTAGDLTARARPHLRRTAHQNPRPERKSHQTKDHTVLQGQVEQSHRRGSHVGTRILSSLHLPQLPGETS